MAVTEIVRSAIRLVPHGLRGRVKDLPLVGPLQRFIVDRQLSGKPFVHTVDAGPARGITFELTLPADKGLWTGTYEADFADRLAAEMTPSVVGYDIGGWHGYFTGIMLAGGAREVRVFEPLPDNQAVLQRMIALNPDRRIHLMATALGEREGTATLTRMAETSMAKLSDSPFEVDRTNDTALEVALTTIDQVVAEGAAPPGIMKLDVEGAEAMVLRGARHTLQTARPVVLAEIHSPELWAEVSAILADHGYGIEQLPAPGRTADDPVRHMVARAR